MTISQAYKDFINQLKRIYPSGEALSIADLIFESTTQMPKWKFRESGEAIPSEYEKSLFQKFRSSRKKNFPGQQCERFVTTRREVEKIAHIMHSVSGHCSGRVHEEDDVEPCLRKLASASASWGRHGAKSY